VLSHVRGRLVSVERDAIVVEAGGLGFRILVSEPKSFHPGRGGEVTVPVVLETSGNEPILVGFPDGEGRRNYRELRRIPGVGPATALRLLPRLDELRRGRTGILEEMKGLGPRRREKILKWLKRPQEEAASGSEKSRALRDALSSLGVSPAEARARASRALRRKPGAALEELIKLAVKEKA